ncbi:MAG: carboxyltransferase domain-containing protein [Rhodobacteraceae bacterium]|nr:carboxyltransferase domain-containing protein [Paracoccaceae bacterium]
MNPNHPARSAQVDLIGDQAVLVTFASRYDKRANQAVHRFDQAVGTSGLQGVLETVPGICSLMITVDVECVDPEQMAASCARLLQDERWWQATVPLAERTVLIPAVYGGRLGPDLEKLARLAGCSQELLVELHTLSTLDVLCLGFAPGTTYLAELPSEYDVPRKTTHSAPVPAGAVLVANRQTVFTATSIPTGWWHIATSPVVGFRPESDKPFLFSAGDRVRFHPLQEEQFDCFDSSSVWEEGES